MRRPVILGAVALAVLACSDPGPESQTVTSADSVTSLAPVTSTTTAGTTTSAEPDAVAGPFRVLVFHRTAGFRHDSIPAGIEAITALGADHDFTVDATEDPAAFTPEGLSPYQVIVFLSTTGDVLEPTHQQAMQEFIEAGHGFVGIHAAADTEYEWEWYGGLVGTYFDRHPHPQPAEVVVTAPDHPVMEGMPPRFERVDEWYDFQSAPGPEAVVLATLDESTYEGGGMGLEHPIAWALEYRGGRSVYTGFGHTKESFAEPIVTTLLANAIRWTAGH